MKTSNFTNKKNANLNYIEIPFLTYQLRRIHSVGKAEGKQALFFLKIIYLFIYLFLAVLGLRFCARAFSSCSKCGLLFIAVRGPLTIAASLVAEHRLQTRGPLTIAASLVAEHRLQTRRLSNSGSRA